MNSYYKRIKGVVCYVFMFAYLCLIFSNLTACDGVRKITNEIEASVNKTPEIENGVFSVHFLYVGEGDCIFINFPSGETMLVDCGDKDEDTAEYIKNCIKKTGKDKIDYFVLTHTDSDHVGNAVNVLEDFSVGTAFVPDIKDKSKFPVYENVYSSLEQKSENIKVSSVGKKVIGEDWFLLFLWPNAGEVDEVYDNINYGDPTSSQINSSSAVIYLSYKGVRFMFMGDVDGSSAGEIALNFKAGLYGAYLKNDGYAVDFCDLDFLKVSHHGASDGNNQSFLNLTKPKNAVISTGLGNSYNHPSSYCLDALVRANDKVNILRTDVLGSISVSVDGNGNFNIKTANE